MVEELGATVVNAILAVLVAAGIPASIYLAKLQTKLKITRQLFEAIEHAIEDEQITKEELTKINNIMKEVIK